MTRSVSYELLIDWDNGGTLHLTRVIIYSLQMGMNQCHHLENQRFLEMDMLQKCLGSIKYRS